MVVDKINVFIEIENAVNEVSAEMSIDKSIILELHTCNQFMKRDNSDENLRTQSSVMQGLVDGLVKSEGLTSSLMVLQARLNQLRSVYGLLD